MQSCSIHHCVLFFLTLTFTTVPTLAVPSIKVKFNHTAALPCKRKCSGPVEWTMSHNRDVVLARCDQGSCHSVEGYGMSHDQYLKGNFSLSISRADYGKRGLYTCQCDSRDVCDVHLSFETMVSLVHKKPGEALVMDLPILEPVEVIYNPTETAGQYSGQICTVDGDTLQCKAEYTHRASLSHSALKLVDTNLSDSGVYVIRDMRNNEVIHMYTVTVEEDHECSQKQQKGAATAWVIVMIMFLVVLVLVGLVLHHRRGNQPRQQKHKNETVEKEVMWPWSSRGAEQELVGRNKKKAESDSLHGAEKAWKRSYSDTALEQLKWKWVEKDTLKHRHMGGAGRGHSSGTEGTQESAHMPLLSEEVEN